MPMKTPQTKGKVLAETAEARRLDEARVGAPWRHWGPYLSERQWGTVREDYSEHGNAWEYLPHDHDRYFDIAVTYAKAGPDDILMEIVATNRGSEPAPLHILPQLWARNVWSWKPGVQKPLLRKVSGSEVVAIHPQLATMRLICDDAPELLFCENESNSRRLWGSDAQGYFKDGINDFVVRARADAVNPEATGTKAAAHYRFLIAGGGSVRLRLRLRPEQAASGLDDFDDFLA